MSNINNETIKSNDSFIVNFTKICLTYKESKAGRIRFSELTFVFKPASEQAV